MTDKKDIRWKQRLTNFTKALKTLEEAVDLYHERQLSNLEKQGLIQGFEFTHELAWKTIKDFFTEKGNNDIYGSRDATREAFNNGLISNGEQWMKMIESRNLSSHTYNNEISDDIVEKVVHQYFSLFISLQKKLEEL